jgi:hypothetical protein
MASASLPIAAVGLPLVGNSSERSRRVVLLGIAHKVEDFMAAGTNAG